LEKKEKRERVFGERKGEFVRSICFLRWFFVMKKGNPNGFMFLLLSASPWTSHTFDGVDGSEHCECKK